MIQELSTVMCAATALALLARLNGMHSGGSWIVAVIYAIMHPREVRNKPITWKGCPAKSWLKDWLRVCIAALAIAYLHKTWQRIDGSPATMTDLMRETALLSVILTRGVLDLIEKYHGRSRPVVRRSICEREDRVF